MTNEPLGGLCEEKLRFASVRFGPGDRTYSYLADDLPLSPGDIVEVPVDDNRKSLATVVAVEYHTPADAPYPVANIKHITRRVSPDLPHDLTGTLFDMVKQAIDALDPEGLLDMGAPEDEYDTECELISYRLREDMSPRQMAKIMADELSFSFSAQYDANYFMPTATQIKEALERTISGNATAAP